MTVQCHRGRNITTMNQKIRKSAKAVNTKSANLLITCKTRALLTRFWRYPSQLYGGNLEFPRGRGQQARKLTLEGTATARR